MTNNNFHNYVEKSQSSATQDEKNSKSKRYRMWRTAAVPHLRPMRHRRRRPDDAHRRTRQEDG